MFRIRPSHQDDILSIKNIYTYYVLNSTCTFETVPPTIHEMIDRRNHILENNLPFLVGELDNSTIVGYGYCTWFKPRTAYSYTVESSIYIEKDMCGKGYGRQLLNALIDQTELVGKRKIIITIGDSTNESSINLHRSAGFSHIGTIKSCGWKFNRWIDIILMEKNIGEGDRTAPDQ